MTRWFAISIVLLVLLAPRARAAQIDVSALLKETEQTVEKVDADRRGLLLELAGQYAKHGERHRAQRILEHLVKQMTPPPTAAIADEHVPEKNLFLGEVARAEAKFGYVAEALQTTNAISDSFRAAFAQSNIADVQAEAGDFQGALTTCDRIDSQAGWWKAVALGQVAFAQANAGHFDASLHTVKLIEGVPAKDDDTRKMNRACRNNALMWIAREMAKRGRLKEALQTAERDDRVLARLRAFEDIAKIQVKRCDKAGAKVTARKALRLAAQLHDIDAIWEAAATQAAVGDVTGAIESTSKYLTSPVKAYALLPISLAQISAGERDAAARSFDEALAVIRKGALDDSLLQHFAVEQAKAGQFERAIKVAEAIRNSPTKAAALREIAIQVLKRHDVPRALKIADSIKDSYHRALALRSIAVAQAKAKQPVAKQTFEDALEAAKSIEIGGGTDVIALCEVGLAQVQAGCVDAAAKTFDDARRKALQYKEATYAAALMQDIARSQSGGGDPGRALTWARLQSSPLLKARSLVGVAQGLVEGPEKRDP